MALKFVAVLSVFSILLFTSSGSLGIAGGPPVVAPPVCAPPACAPPTCGPPSCGPTGGPFALFGGCLGMVTNICGAVIGIPSAIMGGLLAPAPRRMPRPVCGPVVCAPPTCAPPTCGPPVCAPPACAPPVCAPSRITKCRPYAYENQPQRPLVRYQAQPYFAPAAYGPRTEGAPAGLLPAEVPSAVAMVPHVLDMPFKLVSGTLQGSGIYNMSFANRTAEASDSSDRLW